MNKLLVLCNSSSYGSRNQMMGYFKLKTESNFPLKVELIENSSKESLEKVEKHLGNGGKVLSVDGFIVASSTLTCPNLSERYHDNIIILNFSHPYLMENAYKDVDKRCKYIVFDKSYIELFKKHYKIDAVFVSMPAFGETRLRNYNMRMNDIMITGSYLSPDSLYQEILDNTSKVLEPIVKDILERIQDNLDEEVRVCIEGALEKVGRNTEELVDAFILESGFYFCDYRRRLLRTRLVKLLLENGFVVSCAGVNWNVLKREMGKKRRRLVLQGENVPFGAIPSLNSFVKTVIDVSTDYDDGVHERVGIAVNSGCYVFCLENPYSNYLKGKCDHIKTYKANDFDALVKEIKEISKIKEDCVCELPKELRIDIFIEAILGMLYGKDFEKHFIEDEEKIRLTKHVCIKSGDENLLILDKEEKKIEDTFALKRPESFGAKATIYTAVMEGFSNPSKIFKEIKGIKPSKIYFVSSDMEETNEYLTSFDIEKGLYKNVVFFNSREALKEYLINNENEYLPRLYYVNDEAYYKAMTKELHKKRITSKRSAKVKPFLTLCIPTNNRGPEALRAVKQILKSEFDSEIEVLVSENGSSIGLDRYEDIEKIKDSRLRVYRTPENLYFNGNITKCIKKAKGHFIFFQSDEDYVITQNLEYYLSVMYENKQLDVISPSGDGKNAQHHRVDHIETNSGIILDGCLNANYLSGITLNRKHIMEKNIDALISEMKDSKLLIIYTHQFYSLLALKSMSVYMSPIKLYKIGKESDEFVTPKEGLYQINDVHARTKLAEDLIEAVMTFMELDEPTLALFIQKRIERVYELVKVGYDHLTEQYKSRGLSLETEYNEVHDWSVRYATIFEEMFNVYNYGVFVENLEKLYEDKMESLKDTK